MGASMVAKARKARMARMVNGINGKVGKKGPQGLAGKKGPKGDSCKSELQVHLASLKTYVDMKFRVLQGMMDKTMTRTASTGVVADETDAMAKEMQGTMDQLQSK